MAACHAATVTTGRLSLPIQNSTSLDSHGRLVSSLVDGKQLAAGAPAAPLVSLCDVTRGGAFVTGTPRSGNIQNGLRIEFPGADAEALIQRVYRGKALHFTCRLEGKPELPDRGVLLRFAFPMNCVGWRWHDDTQTSREIAPGGFYENVAPLRAWADLPEWKDKPNLKMGYANRNFCTVVTGDVGVCLSVPLDSPCIFRTAYDGKAQQLQLTYDFALSRDTRGPNAWSFAFDLYTSDPEWGFRSALADYYQMYPDMFTHYVPRPGQWMAFNRLSDIDNANEFRFALQEGAPEPEYDDKIGVLSTTYFTHAGMFANIPGHDPEKDPLPAHDVLVKVMSNKFKQNTGQEGIFEAVGLHDADGRLDVQKTQVYGHIISQFNLDPELPYGSWHLNKTAEQTRSIKEKRGGNLDGFYYDGLAAGLNYRRDHFKSSEAPPIWDPVAKKALLNNFFSSCSFARAAAEQLRPRGQITMMNGAMGASYFVAPWLDVFGSETGLRIPREGLNYMRSIAYQKPYLTLLKGNFEQQIGRAEMELFMKRSLAYGSFPGFFDWPPSGLGPGGRYWDHPEYYERDRDLFRKYLPLCQALAVAGWEPVTFARSSSDKVYAERFGPGDDGVVFLTLLNEDTQPHETALTIDLNQLSLHSGKVKCMDILTGERVPLQRRQGDAVVKLNVPADGVAMLQICTTEQAAAQRLAWALDAVERGVTMREVDADKPPIAVHWRPTNGRYDRKTRGGTHCLVLGGARREEQRCEQWAMLFQPKAAPVTLTVRAAAENLSGAGAPQIQCRTAWVSPSFSHYDLVRFDLPTGTYDFRDFEFTLPAEHPLRGIALMPWLPASLAGKLKIASVRLSDQFGNDYVVDPQFSEWYEPVPRSMRDRLGNEMSGLQASLRTARETALKNLTSKVAQKALLDIGGRCSSIRRWIADEKAEQGCRRVLRDIETVEGHLGEALVTSLGISAPKITGPATAAPGDEVVLTFAAPVMANIAASTELKTDTNAPVRQTAKGAALRVPNTATPGDTIAVTGTMFLRPENEAMALRTSHSIEIVAPITLSLTDMGTDAETGAVRFRASVVNHRNRATAASLALNSPEGWESVSAVDVRLSPGEQQTVGLQVKPTRKAIAGWLDFTAIVKAGTDVAHASRIVLHIPQKSSLLKNAGFEEGSHGWSAPANGAAVDRQVAYSGAASMRLQNTDPKQQSEAYQSVTLNQKLPCPILVRAVSRGEGVTGAKGSGYSLYVDIYYMDGTPLYGRTHTFEPGTTEWQFGELCIEPFKPIRNVNVYLLLRNKTGTVWFDDIALVEDPTRKGNIAREARVTVDSSYSQYDAEPINDGIIYPSADAHWTDEAWASAEIDTDHFIEMSFAEAKTIRRVVVYWSLDASIPRTSAEVQVKVKGMDTWETVAPVEPESPVPQTVINLKSPVASKGLRLYQPRGRGPANRGNLMWVREVEVFESVVSETVGNR